MRIHRWIAVALTACLSFTTTSSDAKPLGTNTACGKFRVRQSWTQLTPEEKKLYQNALISSMKTNEFNEFAKLHMESMSEMQAHSTCAFLLWHKRYLLAYENMLRSQGPEYACVTVPYWDVMKDYASMIDGTCKDIYSCSSIVRDMGGSLNSPTESRTMDGATVRGACYASFAGETYCDDNKKCGCVPRGDLSAQLPSSCGYEGLFNQIAYSTSFGEFTKGLQYGMHNEVHGTMGGFMGTFTSPIDPIFWNWHATIDLMWYLYQQCHVSSSMSDGDIRKSVFGFLQTGDCRYSKDAPDANLNSKIIQQSKTNGMMQDASKNPIIGKYFVDLPTSVGDYVAFNPSGEYAYKYIVPEAFNQKLLQSPDLCRVYYNEWTKNKPTQAPTTPAQTPAPATTTTAPTTKSPTPGATKVPATTTPAPATTTSAPATTTPAPTPAPETTTAAPGTTTSPTTEAPTNKTSAPKPVPTTATPSFDFDDLNGKNKTTMPSKDPVSTTAADSTPVTSTDGSQSNNQNVVPTPGSSSSQSGVTPPSVGETDPCKGSAEVVSDGDFVSDGSAYWEWYTTSREQLNTVFPGNITEIAHQMEYVGCLTFGETFGIKNFTQEFMENFRIQDPRPICQQKVQEVQEGKREIVLETKAFKATSVAVKPGVTPAEPVNADDAYKLYEKRVSLESGMSSPSSTAAAIPEGMKMLIMTIVFVMASIWS